MRSIKNHLILQGDFLLPGIGLEPILTFYLEHIDWFQKKGSLHMLKLVTGKIRIKKMPSGEAPMHIREKWVGLVLPVFAIGENIGSEGVLTRKKTDCGPVYMIPQDLAISTLETASKQAAAWWRSVGFPQNGGYFCFRVSQAKVVKNLKRIERFHQYYGLLEVGVSAHDHPLNHR